MAVVAAPMALASTITSATCAVQPTNSMRWDCDILLDTSDSVRIGHRIVGSGSAWNWSEWTADAFFHDLTIYNVQPGMLYEARVQTADPGPSTPVLLTVATLPAGLANLNLVTEVGTPTTRYVLVDVTGCDLKEYLVVYDTLHGYISWYHDIAFETGGSQLSAYSYSKEGTILGIVDQAWVYEWSFGGQPLLAIPFADCGSGAFDGPCPHHDVRRSPSGSLFVVTAAPHPTETPAGTPWAGTECAFVNDGVQELVGGLSVASDELMNPAHFGYDPQVDPGPDPTLTECPDKFYKDVFDTEALLDWTHVNAVAPFVVGDNDELVLSVPKFSELVRYRPDTNQVMWTLSGWPTRGDLDVVVGPDVAFVDDEGTPWYADTSDDEFRFQHDVNVNNGFVQIFDNHRGLAGPSRVLRFDLEPASVPGGRGTATIVAGWTLPDDSQCPSQGSAEVIPFTGGDEVLALCNATQTIWELDDPTGGQGVTRPAWYLQLDQTNACDGGPPELGGGWYRAYPLVDVGDH
jgi:hypothetical protein